jgi:hypothetical protein
MDKASIRFVPEGVEIEAKGRDVRLVLKDALEAAKALADNYVNRGFNNDFPLSGNDKEIKSKFLSAIGVSTQDTLLNGLAAYLDGIDKVNVQQLENSLYPFRSFRDFSPFQAFLLDFYKYTRAPFFDGYFEHGLKMNIHQLVICLSGYVAARHLSVRIDRKRIAVLIFPLGLKILYYDFYRNIRNSISRLPGLKPEEAVILWFATHLPEDFPEDILILGVEEPGKSISLQTSIPVNVTMLNLRAREGLQSVKKVDGFERLIETALKRGTAAKREPEVDEATEYVKILYLAVQEGYDNERQELAIRAARKETTFVTSDDQKSNRREVSRIARQIASKLLRL